MYKPESNEDDEILKKHLTAFETIGWTIIVCFAFYGIAVMIQFLLVGP